MANVLQDSDELNPSTAGSTGTPTNVSAGASTSSGSGTSLSPTGSPAAPPKVSQEQIGQLNQGFDFSPLMDTVKAQGTTAKNAVDTAQNNFTTALGSAPVFGAEQQNTLNQVLGGQQPLSTGQNLLNTQYTGPSAIDSSSYNPLIQKYNTSANELGSDSGFSTLEGSLQPSLTPGERSFDATIFGQNPKYQQATRDTINDANTLMGRGNQIVSDSQNAITQRQNDINAFNQAAQGYVASQRDAINQALSNQMQAANRYDTGVQNELAAIRNGSLNLGQIGRTDLTFDPNAFQPQNFRSAMQTVPASVAGLGSSGGWSIEPFGGVLSDGSSEKVITDPNGNTFYQAYDKNGNIVATYDAAGRPVNGINLDVLNSMATASQAPITGSAGFNQTVDPNQFLTYNPGQLATRENVATQDQVTRYNNAEALLGLTDLLGAAQPRQNATLGIDASALQQALAKAQSDRNAADAAWLAANTPKPVAMQPAAAPSGFGFGDYEGGGDAGNGEGGAGDEGGSGGSGGGPGEGGAAGSESDNLAKGGLVKRPKQPNYGFTDATKTMPRLAMQKGGYLPPGTGIPGVTDSIPANVNDGEFVTRASSVKALGKGNLAKLNDIDQAPPQKQAQVRNELHTALKQAQAKSYAKGGYVNGYSEGGLTQTQRDRMPSDEFAGPGRSFPVNDAKHAKAAILDAPKALRAGSINEQQKEQIDQKARGVLAKGYKKGGYVC